MNLTVKTLKGGKFTIEVDESNTVAQVKGVVEQTNADLPALSMKLIHAGKVLKDDDVIGTCNIKPNDFLVVMIAKAKKAPAEATPAAPDLAPPESQPSTTTDTTTPSATADTPAPSEAEFPTEVINNLKALGFPESEVVACLRASGGNPDVAVEFLMNGIPPGITQNTTGAATTAVSGGSLDALRNHPQFNDLRRLVQTNPSTLQTVLAQIGQQQPELLRAINDNQAEFLQMMNEPVDATESQPPSPSVGSGVDGASANPFSMDPTQLSTLLSSMPPNEQASMAQMMGMTVEQLRETAQMISAMPQEQVQQYMQMAMAAQNMDMGNLANMMGSPEMRGGGEQVLRLNEEEMAAVNRLTDMGFDRTEAAQAYLACDKNEALAANLLMDGGFGGMGEMEDEGDGDNDMYE